MTLALPAWAMEQRSRWRYAGVSATLALPVVLYVFLKLRPPFDPSFGSGTSHFYVVTGVAVLAFMLACAVAVAARSTPDVRTLFLSLAFLSMAGIFVAHGLGTSPFFDSGMHSHHPVTVAGAYDAVSEPFAPAPAPAVESPASAGAGAYGSYGGAAPESPPSGSAAPDPTMVARGKVVGYSAQFSLLVSAAFFALSVLTFPERVASALQHRWLPILSIAATLLCGYGVTALFYPELIAPFPITAEPLRQAAAIVTIGLLAIAALRFAQAHALALLPLQGAMAIGMVLLIEAQLFMFYGQLWQLSWWMYHFAMLGGFGISAVALLRQRLITGDLGAVVEGLFLRQQVNGLRSRDPRAIHALSVAVAAKDTETAGHIERVGDITVAVGKRLGVPARSLEALRWAGRMHDVGKIGVPNNILRKPGRLTPQEFDVIKTHTVRGFHIARNSEMLAAIAPIIRAHHERLDGSGYPDGLKGDEIPLEARIVAVADVWDALVCDRPYRKAMDWREAADVLAKSAGPHLDPDCVDALFDVLGLPDLSRLGEQVEHPGFLRRAA